jgi:hypothetical protein
MASGRTVEEACLIMAVSMATCQRWKGQYPGVKTDTTTADRIHRWTIGHPPDSRLHCLHPPGLASRVPIPDPEAGKPDQPEPEESTHNEKLS